MLADQKIIIYRQATLVLNKVDAVEFNSTFCWSLEEIAKE